MDNSTASRNVGPQRGEKEDKAKSHSTHRSTRYKEKYQVMRERFDKVNSVKEAYLRDLELANEKLRKIQEENDFLLDAMLANPPPPIVPLPTTNPKRYPSPVPPHLVVPSQGYVPSHAAYQPGPPPPPPPASMYQYPPRSEHPEPVPSQPHGYDYPHPQHRRQYQYPPYGTNDGREGGPGSGHHYPSRSRGLPAEHDSHMDPAYTLQPVYPRIP